MALDPKRLGEPGVLLRYNGTSLVFYIPESDLLKFELPESLQIGGKSDGAFSQANQPTGDELQTILDSPGYMKQTNLLNAVRCPDGMLQIEPVSGNIKIDATKGNKPVIRFPRP